MLQALETKHGLVKGQFYNLQTDTGKAVFKTKGGRKIISVPISMVHEIKLREHRPINDHYYN